MKINDLSSDEKIKKKTFSFGLILHTLVDVTLIALFMKVCLIISWIIQLCLFNPLM